MATLPGLPWDVSWGKPDAPLPDWRRDDSDDGDDNDDPAPVGRDFLTAVLGFDPNDGDGGDGSKSFHAKFNPHHDDAGRFSGGAGAHLPHGGGAPALDAVAGKGPGELTGAAVEGLGAGVDRLGRDVGEKFTFTSGPPKSPKEAQAAERLAGKGQHLVQVKERELVSYRESGDHFTALAGHDVAAEVAPRGDGTHVLTMHRLDAVNQPPHVETHSSRKEAERAAGRHAEDMAAARKSQRYEHPRDLAEFFRGEARTYGQTGAGPHAPTTRVDYRLVRPGAPAKAFGFRRKDMVDRGTEGAIPVGDKAEAHEDNTFGLPDGKPLARAYRRFVRRVKREVLGTLPTIGVAIVPGNWPDLTDYQDPMAAAMTPLLSAYWDEAGQLTRAKLGLDPAEWRVVDPHLHAKIEAQAHDFCASTLATTADDCRAAYRKLREELLAGLVTEGEAVPTLAARVRSVFTGLSREHATLIARTEASRAVHQASLESAKESGVVAGKVWLTAANSCDLCQRLGAESRANPLPLDSEFTNAGGNATYASVRMPPAHPRCRCSTTFVLSPEYRHLADAGEAGALGVVPAEEAA